MKKITIITPCYNEESNIENCYNVIKELFTAGGALSNYRREHIFADNCSFDSSSEILRNLCSHDSDIKVIINSRNFGVFRSMFNALKYATGDAVIVFLPADLQDPPSLIPDMVKLWESGYDIVAGVRANREESVLLRLARRLFYRIVNKISDFNIPENVGEFQLIDKRVWKEVIKNHDHYPYIRGIIASVGFKRVTLPYTWTKRGRGISKNNYFHLVDQALNGIFSFTSVPLRFCCMVGFIVSFMSIAYAIIIFTLAITKLANAPAGTHTLIVALFFFSGIQLFFIGILGEYVTSIHSQVRRVNIVIESEKINL